MSVETSLARYTEAEKARREHIELNKKVFDEHERLVFAVIDAENELRDDVAMTKSAVSNNDFKVTYTPQTQVVYDEDVIRTFLPAEKIPEAIKTVDRPGRISISVAA